MKQIIPFSPAMLDTGFFNVINTRTGRVYPVHNYIHSYCYQDEVVVDFPENEFLRCSKIGDDGRYKLQLREDISFSDWYRTNVIPKGDRIILECDLKDKQRVLTLYKTDTKEFIILNTFWGNRGTKYKVVETEDIVYWRVVGNKL